MLKSSHTSYYTIFYKYYTQQFACKVYEKVKPLIGLIYLVGSYPTSNCKTLIKLQFARNSDKFLSSSVCKLMLARGGSSIEVWGGAIYEGEMKFFIATPK